MTELQLSTTQAAELVNLLDSAISDLSPEIADTDNAEYRAMLFERRTALQSIRGKLNGAGQT